MKKNNHLLLITLLSIFIVFLLAFSSFATCNLSGDFVGPMGDPTPDGKVDFNDLMVFATAYGSEKGDANWNPDGKVNFDDLMVFATNYGKVCLTTWTVMVYMDGDNNLEWCYWRNLDMMESVGSTEEVSIVVQMDPYDDCTGTYRYYITGVEAGSEYPLYPDDVVQSLPEQNMSDPATLTDFVNWASDNYPADHYMLILCDHGAGWREEDEIFKGIIWDDTTGGWEHIDIPELAQSLDTANVNIDILGLDACNMQMIEVAWELGMEMSTPPNYLIASENTGWTPVWPYDDFLAELTGNPNIEQLAICETIVNGYINSFSTLSATMSTFHFNNEFLSNGLGIINDFANALLVSTYQEEISSARSTAQAYVLWDWPQYKDLYDFAQIIKNNVPDCQGEAQAVMDLINSVIVAEGHTGPGMDNSHGLSIYLIDSPAEYDSSYDLLQFAIDTQWDEFLESGEGVVTGVEVIATTRQLQTTGVEPEAMYSFEEENNTLKDYQIANINDGLKGETVNSVLVLWDAYYDVDGYRLYRSVNSGDYTVIFEWQNPPVGSFGYGFYDSDILEGNTYSYYVTAYGPDWETSPSEIVTIEITAQTFLPACSLISPTDSSTITEINPIFSWSPVGLGASDLPYGQVYSGSTILRIYDASTYETAWYIWFDDMTTSTATYDQNGNANPLIPGHTYRWYVDTYGYDNNGNWVASSDSENWEFYYNAEDIVTGVWAYTITIDPGVVTPPDASIGMNGFRNKSAQLNKETKILFSPNFNKYAEKKGEVKDYIIQVEWYGYAGASGYRIYRRVNGGNYSVVHDEIDYSSNYYYFYDNDTSPENTYTYYITAYGSDWETTPSQTVTRDTWLPPCSLISPIDESNITNPDCTFIWNPVGVSVFPYGSIYSGDSYLLVYDYITTQVTWERIFYDNMAVSTITYNDNGLAIPLVTGHNYSWNSCALGYDEYGNLIAGSLAEGWGEITGWNFTYSAN